MRLLRAHGAALALAGLLLAVTSTALGVATAVGAAPGPPPDLITDYAGYPGNAGVPVGCDAGGVQGVTFSLNGSTPVGDLQALPPVQAGGNVVTMSWTGVNAECVGAPIVLVIKDAPAPFFDATALQPAVTPFEVETLTAGPGTMSFVLPSLADLRPQADCFYQLDAILGAPLAVVGPSPSGSFYGDNLRPGGGPNLLISAKNGGYETCAATPRTPDTAPPSSTTEPPAATTTTVPGTPPTTEPPASSPTTAAAQSAQGAQAQRTLAATGTTPWAALAGFIAMGSGLLLLVAGRRHFATRR